MPRTQTLILKSCKIPALYSQETVKDPTVHVKLFTPYSGWTWLLTEYDPETQTGFGFAYNSRDPQGAELGYIDVAELQGMRNRLGLQMVERDIHFSPKPLSEAKKAECFKAVA